MNEQDKFEAWWRRAVISFVSGKKALSESAESITAWEEAKLKPLQQQVAMLVDSIKQNAIRSGFVGMLEPWASVVLHNIQATAEAYEREVAAKALEECAHWFEVVGMPDISIAADEEVAKQLRIMATRLRAAKNGGAE